MADRRLGGGAAVVAFFVVVGALTLAGSALLPAPAEFRHDVEAWGAAGISLVVAIALAHAVAAYPAELLCLATGYAYGFLPALVMMLLLWPASCWLAYWLAGRYGRGVAERFLREDALARADRLGETGPLPLLALRVIPIVPFNFVSYAAGIAGVPTGRFLWTTAVGIAPQLTLVTYAGSRATELSPAEPLVWIVGGAWLLLIVAGQALRRAATGAGSSGSSARSS